MISNTMIHQPILNTDSILWKAGDKITSEKLNNIENRINKNKIIIIQPSKTQTDSNITFTLPISYNDVVNYIESNIMIMVKIDFGKTIVLLFLFSFLYQIDYGYEVYFSRALFSASTPDDFLEFTMPNDNNN